MKKAIPTLNVRLLNRVKRQILKEPKQFQMKKIFAYSIGWDCDTPAYVPNCGTAACIAGWACAIGEKRSPRQADSVRRDPWRKARRLLGLSDRQAEQLFHETNNFGGLQWPDKFRTRYSNATANKQWKRRAKIAAARIDHFIKTGE